MIEKADGKYDDALKSLQTALGMYPRDRVALNQAARILFLKRDYAEALRYLDRVCAVDPEDLQMHYTRMLCLRGMGDAAGANASRALFQRFKAEESAQSITAKPRLLSPENNNERQQVHDHESVPLHLAVQPPESRPWPRREAGNETVSSRLLWQWLGRDALQHGALRDRSSRDRSPSRM